MSLADYNPQISENEIKDGLEVVDREIGDFVFGSRKVEGVPGHVAIICDGNRRWARARGLDEVEGHIAGADNGLYLVKRAAELGVGTLTLWLGDTKNIQKRSAKELQNIVKLIVKFLEMFKLRYLNHRIGFKHLGNKEGLPASLINLLNELEQHTSDRENDMNFCVAFNYGGRDEIVRVVKKIIGDGVEKGQINEDLVAKYLDTAEVGDPDMIIRTGGDYRLSGFMSWQSAPSELFFPDILFPDFNADEFEKLVKEFPNRERRLGK